MSLWDQSKLRAGIRAFSPKQFVIEHITPLLFHNTEPHQASKVYKQISSERQFWSDPIPLAAVQLNHFRISDWFPRVPGLFWSHDASRARSLTSSGPPRQDSDLGEYFEPHAKMGFIEKGGIGTVRLRPRRIDEEDCWLATALTGSECHSGVPLAIPNALLVGSNITWGDEVHIKGRIRYLQDAGLSDIASAIHHSRPLIVFVDEIRGARTRLRSGREPITIAPVALFKTRLTQGHIGIRAMYSFVQCAASSDSELDRAAEWIEKYAKKFKGKLITNFDEQRPVLAGAPLSYQRLVASTHDQVVIERFFGTIQARQIETILQQSGEIHVGHNISVGGSAIINIDSVLNNVTQTLGGAAPGLDQAQKAELERLIQTLRTELDALKASHTDETKAIVDALEKTVSQAVKPPEERKKSLLQLSANGLKEAAGLVKDIAPAVLSPASLIANFVVGLH